MCNCYFSCHLRGYFADAGRHGLAVLAYGHFGVCIIIVKINKLYFYYLSIYTIVFIELICVQPGYKLSKLILHFIIKSAYKNASWPVDTVKKKKKIPISWYGQLYVVKIFPINRRT